MNEREKSIYEAGEELLAERLAKNITEIEAAFRAAPEVHCKAFFDAIQELLGRTAEVQAQGAKGSVRYIFISFLQLGLYTGCYQLRLDAYDDRMYNDLTDTHAYWSPEFIFKYIDSDIAHFRENVDQHLGYHVGQVREHEVMSFANMYYTKYVQIARQLAADLVDFVFALGFPDIGSLTVNFGGYMGQTEVLFESVVEQ